MISTSEMIPELVKACPSFSQKWEDHKQEYQDEVDYLPYIALSCFNAHIIELYKKDETEEFPQVFSVIESLHTEGEAYVKEAATIGILEGLQNQLGTDRKGVEDFQGYLLSESSKWWEQLYLFWDGKIKYVGETINR
jgi:hypothetical protein